MSVLGRGLDHLNAGQARVGEVGAMEGACGEGRIGCADAGEVCSTEGTLVCRGVGEVRHFQVGVVKRYVLIYCAIEAGPAAVCVIEVGELCGRIGQVGSA